MNKQTENPLSNYIYLIEQFVSGVITASDFENRYLKMFKNETYHFEKSVFFRLDELFAVVDGFCSEENIQDIFDFNEEQLLEKAQNVLSYLKAVQYK